jgi:KamA family protein
VETPRFKAYGARHLEEIGKRFPIEPALLEEMATVAKVLPFRVNDYVLEHMIDWDNIPEDPMFQLVFPQPGMLADEPTSRVRALTGSSSQPVSIKSRDEAAAVITDIRMSMHPHPSGQREYNIPSDGDSGEAIDGLQHKYEQTVLYFPANGQTCHTYCTYCFRWAQFTNEDSLRFSAREPGPAIRYLRDHPLVTDVLVTGGDPMVMTEERLRAHVLPFTEVETLKRIRIGTKSLAFWPYRYLTDPDADSTLALFEEIMSKGKALTLMVQFSHLRELENDLAAEAIRRLHSIGIEMFAQAPLIRHVNDDAAIWEQMWRSELALGIVPYYMFVARETGPHDYFKVPLARGHEIFQTAYRDLPGLARTVRGPVMSATAGKIIIDGIMEMSGSKWFQLRFLQARDTALIGRPFLAEHSETAAWATDLTAHPETPADLAAALQMR